MNGRGRVNSGTAERDRRGKKGNKKGGKRRGHQKLVYTSMSEILINTLIVELI